MGTTHGIDEYLETIYLLNREGETVIAARLAEYLGVTAPTVSQTVKRLERDGLLTIGPDRSLVLTPEGRRRAEAIVRRHRLVERWLTDVMGFDWVTAHEEACRLEHAISDTVEARLNEMLNYPETCPHGNPIPGNDRNWTREGISLADAEPGQDIRVERILEQAEEVRPLLEYLQENGLVPGARFRVGEKSPFGGTIRLHPKENEDAPVSVALDTAAHVWVRPVTGAAG